MKNLPSYCGLVDAKIRASDKDLPVSDALNIEKEWQVSFWPLVLIYYVGMTYVCNCKYVCTTYLGVCLANDRGVEG